MTDVGNVQAGAAGTLTAPQRPLVQVVPVRGLQSFAWARFWTVLRWLCWPT